MPSHVEIVAPVPGLVARILAKPGAIVKQGDPIVVLQCMKMDIPVSALHNGTVSEVLVEAGQEIGVGGLIAYLTLE